VLIIQGTTDLQIGVEDAQRLAAARPGSTLLLVEGMNHVMKDAPIERISNFATYNAALLPLSKPVVPAIASFLRP